MIFEGFCLLFAKDDRCRTKADSFDTLLSLHSSDKMAVFLHSKLL